MQNQEDISVRLEGPQNTMPALADFSSVCTALLACVRQVSRCVADAELEFRVSGLSTGSAFISVLPPASLVGTEIAADIVHTFQQTVAALERGDEIDTRLDYNAIRAFNGFSATLGRRGGGLFVSGVKLTARYTNRLKHLLESASPSYGSVTGRLDAINVHTDPRFTLYTQLNDETIQCQFQKGDLDRVLSAVGRKVTVFGTLQYAKRKILPVKVEVQSFDIEPDDKDLPSLVEARGTLKLAKPSEIIIREDRDAW